jgi:hypothetical protein
MTRKNATSDLTTNVTTERAKHLKRGVPRECLRCHKLIAMPRQLQKRCIGCQREHELESHRTRWHANYQKTGWKQSGAKNNNWKGGRAPRTYRRICFEAHGRKCIPCGAEATLAHHIDHDRSNNVAENLRPMCKRCHQLEHNCTANLPTVVRFKMRACLDCKKKYRPSGPRQIWCRRCAPIYKARTRDAHRQHSRSRGKG